MLNIDFAATLKCFTFSDRCLFTLFKMQLPLNNSNVTKSLVTGVGEPGNLQEQVLFREALRQHEEGGSHSALQVPHQRSTHLPVFTLH